MNITHRSKALTPMLNITAMQHTVSRRTETSAPAQSLPPEVLVVIFITCLESAPPLPKSPKEAVERRVPIILASVCQQWRFVACNISELWTTCWLSYNGPELNSIWLARAGKQQILTLDGSILPDSLRNRKGSGSRYRKTAQFHQSISPYLRQCHSLLLCTEVFDQLCSRDINIDEALHLRVLRTDRAGIPPFRTAPLPAWVEMILDKAPNIQMLSLWETVHAEVLCKLQHLIDLQLGFFHSPWDLLEILRSIPTLQRLKVKKHFLNSLPPPDHLDPVIHTSLTELECTFHIKSDLVPFLNSLTLPALQSFTCNSEFIVGAGLPTTLFLSRSQCILKELTLWCYPSGIYRPAVDSSYSPHSWL
jgi:hypothetical protein